MKYVASSPYELFFSPAILKANGFVEHWMGG